MSFRIGGFGGTQIDRKEHTPTYSQPVAAAPRMSVVQVRFPGKGMALSYYNDQFDLKKGDLVYVDGKLEGQLGRVTEVNYNFKIKISDYKKVIAVVDTEVHGEFFMAGSHFVAFDPSAIPAEQIVRWFKAPPKEDEEYVSGNDETAFRLDDLKGMNITGTIAERGHEYYIENRVRYLCIDNGHGIAIVEGTDSYIVEFEYRNGEISHLVCECPCSYTCKHEFAAMLQLRETLEIIDKHYSEAYERTGYFAAINKGTLFAFVIDGKDSGRFTL